MSPKPAETSSRGFTLIELLVVIAIIAILAAILFPVFAKAREKARQTTCMNNQRQIAVAVQMFTQDHEETYPDAPGMWSSVNLPKAVIACPTAGINKGNGYVYNNAVAGKAIGDVPDQVNTFLTADGTHAASAADATKMTLATYDNVAYVAADLAGIRHTNRVVASFADGHCASVVSSTLEAQLTGLPMSGNFIAIVNPGFDALAVATGQPNGPDTAGAMYGGGWTVSSAGSGYVWNKTQNLTAFTNSAGGAGIIGTDDGTPQIGGNYLPPGGTVTLTQTLATNAIPGKKYTLTCVTCGFTFTGFASAGAEQIGFSFGGANHLSPDVAPGLEALKLKLITYSYTAQAGETGPIKIILTSTGGGTQGIAFYDNVKLAIE